MGIGYAKGEVDNFPVKLLFRLATSADIKQVSKQKQQVCYGNFLCTVQQMISCCKSSCLFTDKFGFSTPSVLLTGRSVST